MWRTRLHMWTKFGDDWLQTATCIAENVTISFKHEYRRPRLTSRSGVINIKNTFSGIISDDLSISIFKLNLSKIFRNFPNGRHFDVRVSFVTGSPTGSWVQPLKSQSNSLHFELLIAVVALILTELWQFWDLTYFLTLWPSYLTFDIQNLQADVWYQAAYVDQV